MLVLLMGGFMKYAVEMSSVGMIYIPIFMKFDVGVLATETVCLKNLRDYNVGITDVRDL
jgi:hypothetical protein